MPIPEGVPTQTFTLGEVLSITTKKLMAPMESVYKILNWMTDDSLFTHQLPRACEECQPWLLRWYPALQPIDVSDVTGENWRERLTALEAQYGNVFPVPRIPRDDHAVKDPIEELAAIVGHDRIVVLQVDGKVLDVLPDPILVWDDWGPPFWYGHLEDRTKGDLYRIERVTGGFFVGRQIEAWGDYGKLAITDTVDAAKLVAEKDAQQRQQDKKE